MVKLGHFFANTYYCEILCIKGSLTLLSWVFVQNEKCTEMLFPSLLFSKATTATIWALSQEKMSSCCCCGKYDETKEHLSSQQSRGQNYTLEFFHILSLLVLFYPFWQSVAKDRID